MLLLKTSARLSRCVALATALIGLSGQMTAAQTILIDFGNTAGTTGDNWNNSNINGYGINNMVTSSGTSTAYDLTFTTAVGQGGNWDVGAAPSPFNIASARNDGLFTAGAAITFQLSDLNSYQTYDLTLFGSRSATGTRITDYTVTGGSGALSQSLQTSGTDLGGAGINYNNSAVSTFGGVMTDASNRITVTFATNTGGFAYLNAMQLVGYTAYQSGGSTNISSAREYLGQTTINGGTVVNAEVAGVLPTNTLTDLAITGAGSALNLGASQSVASLSGGASTTIAISNGTTLTVSGAANSTHAGTISGGGTLLKSNSSTLQLSASNAFTGTATVAGGTLALNHTDALRNATLNTGTAGSQSVTFAVAGNNTYNLGALGGSNALAMGGNSLSVGGNNANTTFAGTLSGSGLLTKIGTGTTTLSGSNAHSGGTTLSAGRLNLNNASALGTGTFTLQNGASFNNTSGGAISNANNNAVSLAGTNTYAGSSALHLGTGSVTIAEANRLIVSGGSLTLGGDISGSAGFNKDGGGTLTLANSNAMTSYTVVDFGILNLAHTHALANAQLYVYGSASNKMTTFGLDGQSTYHLGALSGSSTGILLIGANTISVGQRNINTSYDGVIEGSGGTFLKTGTGTITLSGANTHSGGTTIASGRVNISNAAALGTGTLTLQNGSSFNNTSGGAISNANNNAVVLAGTNTFAGSASMDLGTGSVTISTNSRLVVDAGALTLRGTVSGSASFNKDGAGTLTLAGSNAMTSYTVLDYGVLNLGHANALANAQLYLYGTSAERRVAFGLAGNNTYHLGALSGTNTAVLALGGNSVSVGANNIATTYAGAIEGTGGLTKTGNSTFTLTGTSTYTGATTVSSGKLVVNGTISSSPVTVANGAELGGSGTSGTLTVQNGGTIAPGNSAGTFNINGDIVWQNGGSYDWEIFNLAGAAGSGWDLVDATGSLDLNGLTGASDFVINLFSLSTDNTTAGALAGFDAGTNYDWMIASFSGLSGSFDLSRFTINTAGFTTYNSVGTGLFSLEISEAQDSLYLTYRAGGAPVPEPGTWAAAAILLSAAGLHWRRRRLAARN